MNKAQVMANNAADDDRSIAIEVIMFKDSIGLALRREHGERRRQHQHEEKQTTNETDQMHANRYCQRTSD
jgi:hypothetical protein